MRIGGHNHDNNKHNRGAYRADQLDLFNDAAAYSEQKENAGKDTDRSKNDLQIKQE